MSGPLLRMTSTPEHVYKSAALYLRMYLLGIPFMMIYNFGAAVLRSIGDTKRPLYIMILSGAVNLILNLIFVIGLRMEVAGVALATALSNVLSAGIVVWLLTRESGMIRLDLQKLRIRSMYLKKIIQVGLPAGLQGMIFSVSNLLVQGGINSFGPLAIAGSSAALNFEYFTYDFAVAFSQATVTFTSQNFGAGQYERCRKVFWLIKGGTGSGDVRG